MKKIVPLLVFLSGSLVAAERCVVGVPVASVWTKPQEIEAPFTYPAFANPTDGSKSLGTLDTQACYGMPVRVLDKSSDPLWLVELLMQPCFNTEKYYCQPIQGYMRGGFLVPDDASESGAYIWVAQSTANRVDLSSGGNVSLPFGSVIRKDVIDFDETTAMMPITLLDGKAGNISFGDVRYIPQTVERVADLQLAIYNNALKFLGMPYCWGGTSVFLGQEHPTPSSVDCSGFIYLLMHSLGLMIPRNSPDQILFATSREPADAEPGDVFFLKSLVNGNPNHILMYLGENEDGEPCVIEASGISGLVCTSRVAERFGVSLCELKNDMVLFADHETKRCRFSCGTFLGDQAKLQFMRNSFLMLVS